MFDADFWNTEKKEGKKENFERQSLEGNNFHLLFRTYHCLETMMHISTFLLHKYKKTLTRTKH